MQTKESKTIKGKCTKRRLRTELDAKIALASTYRSGKGKREEKRYYPCPVCKGYHLTSH